MDRNPDFCRISEGEYMFTLQYAKNPISTNEESTPIFLIVE